MLSNLFNLNDAPATIPVGGYHSALTLRAAAKRPHSRSDSALHPSGLHLVYQCFNVTQRVYHFGLVAPYQCNTFFGEFSYTVFFSNPVENVVQGISIAPKRIVRQYASNPTAFAYACPASGGIMAARSRYVLIVNSCIHN